jgi:hypothetical protein
MVHESGSKASRPRKIMIIERCTQCPFHALDHEHYEETGKLYCVCNNPQVYSETGVVKGDRWYMNRIGEGRPIVCDFPHGNAVLRREYNPFPSWCPLQAFNPIQSSGFWGEVTVAPDAERLRVRQQVLEVA